MDKCINKLEKKRFTCKHSKKVNKFEAISLWEYIKKQIVSTLCLYTSNFLNISNKSGKPILGERESISLTNNVAESSFRDLKVRIFGNRVHLNIIEGITLMMTPDRSKAREALAMIGKNKLKYKKRKPTVTQTVLMRAKKALEKKIEESTFTEESMSISPDHSYCSEDVSQKVIDDSEETWQKQRQMSLKEKKSRHGIKIINSTQKDLISNDHPIITSTPVRKISMSDKVQDMKLSKSCIQSLNIGQPIHSDVIDEYMYEITEGFEISKDFIYVPSHLFTSLGRNEYTTTINYCKKHKVVEYGNVLSIFNDNSKSISDTSRVNHWIFVSFNFDTKKVLIYDSTCWSASEVK